MENDVSDVTVPSAKDITFLVVGCQRCGSTWLYEALKEHPEIFLPEKKQTHFFNQSYHNGMDWYMQHFKGIAPSHKAVGEVATYYCLPDVLPKVAHELPHIKIVIAMRNPVERANSYFRSRAPHENWKTLKQAIDEYPNILSMGQYSDQIDVLLSHYPEEDILYLFYDDLSKDERNYISRVYEFLGVSTDFVPSVVGNPVRAAMFPGLRLRLKNMGLTPLINLINKSFLGDILRRILRYRRVNRKKPVGIPEEMRKALAHHFLPFNQKLTEITGRDLSHWR